MKIIKLKQEKSIKGSLQKAGTVLSVGNPNQGRLFIGHLVAQWLVDNGFAEIVSESPLQNKSK